MQGRSVVSVPVRPYDDLHILIERHEKAQKTLDGKLPELPAQHFLIYRALIIVPTGA
jgi:hypothetical protein